MAHLKSRGVGSAFHYLPLHLSDVGRRYGGRKAQFPVTESVSDRLLRLPVYHSLTETEQDRVLDATLDFRI
jgi:dTDP-4-amino-4,6-dideoxygalactose transaminase